MEYTELIAQIRDALSVTHPRDDLDLELVRQAADAIEALQARCGKAFEEGRDFQAQVESQLRTQRDAALVKLAELEKQAPVAFQFQTTNDGKWHDFLDEKHYQNTMEDGRWPIRALYLAPVPAKTLSEEQIRKALAAWFAKENESTGFEARMHAAIETALKGGA